MFRKLAEKIAGWFCWRRPAPAPPALRPEPLPFPPPQPCGDEVTMQQVLQSLITLAYVEGAPRTILRRTTDGRPAVETGSAAASASVADVTIEDYQAWLP